MGSRHGVDDDGARDHRSKRRRPRRPRGRPRRPRRAPAAARRGPRSTDPATTSAPHRREPRGGGSGCPIPACAPSRSPGAPAGVRRRSRGDVRASPAARSAPAIRHVRPRVLPALRLHVSQRAHQRHGRRAGRRGMTEVGRPTSARCCVTSTSSKGARCTRPHASGTTASSIRATRATSSRGRSPCARTPRSHPWATASSGGSFASLSPGRGAPAARRRCRSRRR
jgi:hypothetical protein